MDGSQTLQPISTGEGPSLLDLALAKRISETLDRHYPDHLWGVCANSAAGIVSVFNLRLSGRWGFVLKMSDLAYEDEIVREAKRAGGELLERYRLSRGRYRPSEYEALPVNLLGDLIPDAD